MRRRYFILGLVGLGSTALVTHRISSRNLEAMGKMEKVHKADEQWRKILTPEQYRILREEGTEPPFSSPLDKEFRKGIYVCAGCALQLFTSEMKFDSGTGWPSFYTSIEGSLETKRDFKLIFPRTEYHCARCDGHQGHVFNDGPEPTGKRWCNNGVALKFIPDENG